MEVMACPGGCVGGGGQPIHDSEELALTRSQNFMFLDASNELRFCHENPDIQKLYQYFMGAPLSHKAHMLLHTDHNIWEMPRENKKKIPRQYSLFCLGTFFICLSFESLPYTVALRTNHISL
ncbi:MAG: iron hydrogenase small subunit [[Clostridium] nexile]